ARGVVFAAETDSATDARGEAARVVETEELTGAAVGDGSAGDVEDMRCRRCAEADADVAVGSDRHPDVGRIVCVEVRAGGERRTAIGSKGAAARTGEREERLAPCIGDEQGRVVRARRIVEAEEVV